MWRPDGTALGPQHPVDDEVDQLDPDERGDQTAEPVHEEVAPQQRVRPGGRVELLEFRQRKDGEDFLHLGHRQLH